MLGVVCGALNVADAAFRTCMTDFLHSLERCRGGAARAGAVGPDGHGHRGHRECTPKGLLLKSAWLLQARRPGFCFPLAIFFLIFVLQIWRQCLWAM